MFVRKRKNRSGATSVVGFDAIDDDILKHLVTARISQPSSKSGTIPLIFTRYVLWVNLSASAVVRIGSPKISSHLSKSKFVPSV